jgi:eukaryotic-like serine/threonine-protein kinase
MVTLQMGGITPRAPARRIGPTATVHGPFFARKAGQRIFVAARDEDARSRAVMSQSGNDQRTAGERPMTPGAATMPVAPGSRSAPTLAGQISAMAAPVQHHVTAPAPVSPAHVSTGPGLPSDAVPASLSPGTVIGQYELIRLLGRGGMGEVHLARDLRLGRLVAVKTLAARWPGLAERFLVEARTTARCHHENIVVIHDVGEIHGYGGYGGHPYMVLEYLEGQTLREWLHEHAAAAAAAAQPAIVPPGRAVELMLPVVRALAYAHERGIVHRDLKPENIVLSRSGSIKVLDFGIAKLLSAPPIGDDAGFDGAGDANTNGDALVGTLAYMSPEQMNARAVDHRTDLWAVGVMLFELVAGRHPLSSEDLHMGHLLRIADDDLPMPSVREAMPDQSSDLGPLAAVIDRCLIKSPAHRTDSARALLAELEALASGRRSVQVGDDGSPFAGLAAFQEADADRFFGRDRDIDQIVTELRSRPLVAVVGPSGVGKSSLIRAGVIPELKRSGEGWDTCVIRPGRAPLAALAGVLAQAYSASRVTADGGEDGPLIDSDAHAILGPAIEHLRAEPGYLGARLRARAASKLRWILIFVDQFEELYTLGVSAGERAAFLASLAAVADDAASPLRVILAMRSDFLDRLTENRHLSAEVTRGLVLLPAMGRDGLREALLRPIDACGLRFESAALVDRMVDALDSTPGALPLLQFTAARLWELRDVGRRRLTEASYEQLGGVAGALASHADAVLARMSSPRQALARAVLERLVTPERTRALVGVSELGALHPDAGAVEDVIQHLAAMRLVVIDDGDEGGDRTVELVHESLIDRWPTLARWLDENHEDAAFLARLRGAAQEWQRDDRDEGLLWRGAPAREAQLWHARYRGALTTVERGYLDAVLALELRTVRRRRRLLAGAMALLAMLLVAALVALIRIQRAEREAKEQAARAESIAVTVREQLTRIEIKERELRAVVASEIHARAQAEGAQRVAEQAQQRAEAESARARVALAEGRRDRDRALAAVADARRAEAHAREAVAEARVLLKRAEAAAETERRRRQELEQLIEGAVGKVDKVLR